MHRSYMCEGTVQCKEAECSPLMSLARRPADTTTWLGFARLHPIRHSVQYLQHLIALSFEDLSAIRAIHPSAACCHAAHCRHHHVINLNSCHGICARQTCTPSDACCSHMTVMLTSNVSSAAGQ